MLNTNKEKVISFLSVILLIFTIAFAVLYNSLHTEVKPGANESWSVLVSSITPGVTEGDAKNIDVEIMNTNAIVNFTMSKPGDTITYKIKNINAGTMDAVLNSILVVGNNEDISYDISGVIIGSGLNAGGADNIIITFKNNSTEEKEIQQRVAIIFNYK